MNHVETIIYKDLYSGAFPHPVHLLSMHCGSKQTQHTIDQKIGQRI